MAKIQNIFLKGLFTLLPLALTIYVIYSVIRLVENMVRAFLPDAAYIPGIGLVLTFVLIFTFGWLLNKSITASLMEALEKKLTEVPFIKAIYSPLRDLMNLFSKTKQKDGQKVVLVDLFGQGYKSIGLVTRDQFKDLPSIQQYVDKTEPMISVFVPLSYGLGGFTYLIPKSKVMEIDLSMEKAMSLAITGWIKAETKENPIENKNS